jgi:hypothetical protein
MLLAHALKLPELRSHLVSVPHLLDVLPSYELFVGFPGHFEASLPPCSANRLLVLW